MSNSGSSDDALASLVCVLRKLLMDARSKGELDAIEELKVALTILREASYDVGIEGLTTVLVMLEDSARDSLLKVEWKSTIPTEDDIRRAIGGAARPT